MCCLEAAHLVDTGRHGNPAHTRSVRGRGHRNLHWHRRTFDCSHRRRNLAYILSILEREMEREMMGESVRIDESWETTTDDRLKQDFQDVQAVGVH